MNVLVFIIEELQRKIGFMVVSIIAESQFLETLSSHHIRYSKTDLQKFYSVIILIRKWMKLTKVNWNDQWIFYSKIKYISQNRWNYILQFQCWIFNLLPWEVFYFNNKNWIKISSVPEDIVKMIFKNTLTIILWAFQQLWWAHLRMRDYMRYLGFEAAVLLQIVTLRCFLIILIPKMVGVQEEIQMFQVQILLALV